jgi:hypothetical protein
MLHLTTGGSSAFDWPREDVRREHRVGALEPPPVVVQRKMIEAAFRLRFGAAGRALDSPRLGLRVRGPTASPAMNRTVAVREGGMTVYFIHLHIVENRPPVTW